MISVPRNIVSAVLTALFAVVAISGVLMFFKIRLLSMEAMHIWLGLAFVVIALLHLLKNWSAFSNYFKKQSTTASILAIVVVCSLFIATALLDNKEKGVNPKQKIFSTVMVAPLSSIALFFNLDAEAIVKNLHQQSQILATPKQSVSEIAKASGKSNDEILQIIFNTPTK